MKERKMNRWASGTPFPRGEDLLRSAWFPCLLLLLVNYALYFKVLAFSFTNFDDNIIILAQRSFLQDFRNIATVFSRVYFTGEGYFYRPLLNVSFFHDAFLGGSSPFFYHLTNLVIHSAASLLLFAFLKGLSFRPRAALLFALLFTVHPVLVPAVAWIPGRNDSLLFVFFIASFILLIRYFKSGNIIAAVLHVFLFFLAVLTKESAIAGVAVFVLYILFLRQKNSAGSLRIPAAGWALAVGAWYFLRHSAAFGIPAPGLAEMGGNMAKGLPAIVLYIGKIFFPANLSVLPILKDSTLLYGAGVLLLLLAAAIVFRRYCAVRYLFFGLAWFFLFLLPSMLVSSPYYLEHRLYLPIVGFIFVVYGITGTAVEIFPAVWRYAGVLAVLVLAAINYAYCDSFSSALLLWQSAVRASPSSAVAHNSLAVAYMERGVLFAAEQEITRALAIDPLLSNALNNRALLLMNRGMLKEAESDLEKAAATDHHNYLIYVHYAQLRLLQNRPDEITPFLEKALRINPEYLPAYKMLAEYYAGKGQYEKAVPFIEELNKRPEGRKIAEAAFAGIDRRTVSGNNAARNKN